jgi:hypothetical protein
MREVITEHLRQMILQNKFRLSSHALKRSVEREIAARDLAKSAESGHFRLIGHKPGRGEDTYAYVSCRHPRTGKRFIAQLAV